MGRARRRVRPAANTLEERGAERDRPGGDADRRRAHAIRAAGVVVEQHLVDDVEVALARQDVDFLEIGRLLDAILDLERAVRFLVDEEVVALDSSVAASILWRENSVQQNSD